MQYPGELTPSCLNGWITIWDNSFVTQFFVGSPIGQKIKGQKMKNYGPFVARTPNGHDVVVYVECDHSEFPLGLPNERLSANGIGITQ